MKEKLNILLLGSGGRESAIAYKLLQSPRTARLWVAPGNASPAFESVDLPLSDFEAIAKFVADNEIDLIFVGPEQPLVDGIADFFADSKVKVIGPVAEAARLEGSKEFAKEFMFRHAIPTARFMTVTADTLQEGEFFLESLQPPYVLKADGLAAGKGVLIIPDLEEAKAKLHEMLEGMFGKASHTVVIEQFLDGIECSVFVATDGEDYRVLPVAKDYKRIGEGDTGPNTGGMGAVSPVPFADEAFMEKVRSRIIEPTIRGLREEGIDYRGFIFLGLINVGGDPMVIEYNVRLGDPETEVVMPRLKSDLVDLVEGIADRTMALKHVEEDPRAAATVMLVSDGYPGTYRKGMAMEGAESNPEGCILFHAGTRRNAEGRPETAGGRVLAVTAFGPDIHQAAATALKGAESVKFEGKRNRTDIGADL